MVSLELQGWWWAPEQPDNPVPGNLTFAEDNGLKLSLMGSLSKEEYPSESSPLGEPLPIILGVVSGKEATLVDATPRRRHFSIPGFNAVEYRVGTAYLGQHYGTVADLAFDKVTLNSPTWKTGWLQVPIYRRYPPSEEWPKRHEVGFVQEEPISGAIRNGSVMLGHDVNVSERASSATIQRHRLNENRACREADCEPVVPRVYPTYRRSTKSGCRQVSSYDQASRSHDEPETQTVS